MNNIFFKINKYLLIIFLAIFIATFFINIKQISAQNLDSNDKIIIHFFWGKGCPHCEKEKEFLAKIQNKYDYIELRDYEVWNNQENINLLKSIGKELNADISGVPFTVIGENYFSGWLNDEISGTKLESYISCAKENKCEDVVSKINNNEKSNSINEKSVENKIPDKIEVPFIGDIDIKNFSLPILAIVIGVLDGFNPCAMWVLIFLISFLVGMKDKKKMWIFGITFIASSAFVYFLFMIAWLNLILFLGFIIWVRMVIAIIAIGGGIYNLREFIKNKNATCQVTNEGQKQKIIDKLKKYTHEKKFWLAIIGLILLAFSVNLIEAVCSAGLPVIFTQILTLSDIPTWKYYLYILIYIFFFMLDDIIIFVIAIYTLKITGLSSKYSHYSHLIGGILMIIIGLLLFFKPEWLMFG